MAFEAMVIKYQPKLFSSLIGYTKSHDQAEELCQKTFIRVWQKIDTFRGDSALVYMDLSDRHKFSKK